VGKGKIRGRRREKRDRGKQRAILRWEEKDKKRERRLFWKELYTGAGREKRPKSIISLEGFTKR